MADRGLNREISRGFRYLNDLPLSPEIRKGFERGSLAHYLSGNMRECQMGLVAIGKADTVANLMDTVEKQGQQMNQLLTMFDKQGHKIH